MFLRGSDFLCGRFIMIEFLPKRDAASGLAPYNCHECPDRVESTLHVLRDCCIASGLWNKILDPSHFDFSFEWNRSTMTTGIFGNGRMMLSSVPGAISQGTYI